jgi:cytochrome c-type biogenesis protein CcmF
VNLFLQTPTAASADILTFKNEWLWLGNLGQAFIILTFMSAVASMIFFYQHEKNGNDVFKKAARNSFFLHAFSVLAIFSVLFAIIFFHRYEYYYAWRHSSNSLPVYYMISCFWEGQEGSFLLWIFWNAVIGLVLIKNAKKWESPVMAVIAFGQVALSSMLLGLEFQGVKIGSSPFELLRDARPDFLNIPILGSLGIDNYLSVFNDGNGLNKLLQNYWMVIHPPTLFLGFALAIVPFAYSIAALWRKEDRTWLQPALIWSLACVGVLGTGIIMGGFWAYESLSFGGYWAWDPVENASLLPWLIMTSAAHMLLISKNTGRHMFTSHLLVQLSFWLVLYATFLTRSGILGEASVHSFTDLGLSGQLLLFLLVFIGLSASVTFKSGAPRKWFNRSIIGIFALAIGLSFIIPEANFAAYQSGLKWFGITAFLVVVTAFVWNLYVGHKSTMEDEKLSSREFWMFLGAMFIILSLIQIFTATSIPVFNKLFGFRTAVPLAKDYNAVQLWMAMPIMLLMAIGQYFSYRQTNWKTWAKDASITAAVSIVVGILLNLNFKIEGAAFLLFLFLAIWLSLGNILYIWRLKKLGFLAWGSSISHFGFGVLLVGVLVSSVNKKVLSATQEGIQLAPEQDEKGNLDQKGIQFNRENRILYKDVPAEMGDYQVRYNKFVQGINYDSLDKFFYVSFWNALGDTFTLVPKTQNNPKMGLLAEPSTRHYIHKDVFTHINYESGMDKKEPFSGFVYDTVRLGTTFTTASGKCLLTPLSLEKTSSESGLVLRLVLVANRLNQTDTLYPQIRINEKTGNLESISDQRDAMGLFASLISFDIEDPDPNKQKISFVIQTGEKEPVRDYVVLKVVEFPWINLVWAGTIIMVVGFVFAISNRVLLQRKLTA